MTKADKKSTKIIKNDAKYKVANRENNRLVFTVAVLNMSWQLAVLVLVLIAGGYWLDEKMNTIPILTILGIILALVGSIFVIKRQIDSLNISINRSENTK